MRYFVLLLSSLAAQAQSTAVLKHTFDSDTEGWMVMGTSGSVKVSKESKVGAGALAYTYSFDGRGINTALMPAGAGKLAEMRRIRFWMKADHDAAFAVGLTEKKPGGGDYSSIVWAQKNTWQRVDLGLADFMLNEGGPADAVDADGKLDPDQVEAIGILDLSAFFNQMPAETPMVVSRKSGEHTLLIDDFEVLNTSPKSGSLVIDAFDRGYLQWMTMGGVDLSLAPADNPLGAPALAASLKGVEGKLTILVRRVNASELAGAKRLAFDIASEHGGTFTISIETRKPGAQQGPRYNFLIYPPEGRKAFRVNISLADFDHDGNSPEDPAGKLEASRIKTIAIGDITGLTGGAVADNKIWIGRLEMIK